MALLRRLIRKASEDDLSGLSAQLAFNLLFGLFPFLLFLVTMLAYLPIQAQVGALLDNLEGLIPSQARQILRAQLTGVLVRRRPLALIGSLLVALWSASKGAAALIAALNRAFGVTETRKAWQVRLRALLATLLAALAFPAAFGALLLGGEAGRFLTGLLKLRELPLLLWRIARFPLALLLAAVALSATYHLLPNRRQRYRLFTPGSVSATLGWVLASWGFTSFVDHSGRYTATYGSLTGAVLLMMWLYWSAAVVILGGELDALLAARRRLPSPGEAG